MEVTFLVTVDLPDVSPQALMDEAATIQQDLFSSGLDVISVKPWERPTMGQASPLPNPDLPNLTKL